jgi:hypothetical protein
MDFRQQQERRLGEQVDLRDQMHQQDLAMREKNYQRSLVKERFDHYLAALRIALEASRASSTRSGQRQQGLTQLVRLMQPYGATFNNTLDVWNATFPEIAGAPEQIVMGMVNEFLGELGVAPITKEQWLVGILPQEAVDVAPAPTIMEPGGRYPASTLAPGPMGGGTAPAPATPESAATTEWMNRPAISYQNTESQMAAREAKEPATYEEWVAQSFPSEGYAAEGRIKEPHEFTDPVNAAIARQVRMGIKPSEAWKNVQRQIEHAEDLASRGARMRTTGGGGGGRGARTPGGGTPTPSTGGDFWSWPAAKQGEYRRVWQLTGQDPQGIFKGASRIALEKPRRDELEWARKQFENYGVLRNPGKLAGVIAAQTEDRREATKRELQSRRGSQTEYADMVNAAKIYLRAGMMMPFGVKGPTRGRKLNWLQEARRQLGIAQPKSQTKKTDKQLEGRLKQIAGS